MPTAEAILEVLHTIDDPEMPISIVDLGIVENVQVADTPAGGTNVSIAILPTFVGCPALEMIERIVRERVGAMGGVASVDVRFVFDPPWTVDRITDAGRLSLKAHGVTVPEKGSRLPVHNRATTVALRTSAVPCPFCGSSSTMLESPFGPTRCRMIYYCESCRNSFEHLRRVDVAGDAL